MLLCLFKEGYTAFNKPSNNQHKKKNWDPEAKIRISFAIVYEIWSNFFLLLFVVALFFVILCLVFIYYIYFFVALNELIKRPYIMAESEWERERSWNNKMILNCHSSFRKLTQVNLIFPSFFVAVVLLGNVAEKKKNTKGRNEFYFHFPSVFFPFSSFVSLFILVFPFWNGIFSTLKCFLLSLQIKYKKKQQPKINMRHRIWNM